MISSTLMVATSGSGGVTAGSTTIKFWVAKKEQVNKDNRSYSKYVVIFWF